MMANCSLLIENATDVSAVETPVTADATEPSPITGGGMGRINGNGKQAAATRKSTRVTTTSSTATASATATATATTAVLSAVPTAVVATNPNYVPGNYRLAPERRWCFLSS